MASKRITKVVTKDNTKLEKRKVKANLHGTMEQSMKEISWKECSMVKGDCLMKTKNTSMKDSLKRVKSMEKGLKRQESKIM